MKSIKILSFPKSVIGNLNLRKKAEWILKSIYQTPYYKLTGRRQTVEAAVHQDDVVEVPDNDLRVRQYNKTTRIPDKSSPGWNKGVPI